MNIIPRFITTVALLAFAATPALAADNSAAASTPEEQKVEKLFADIDANGDGVIDATEAEAEKGLAKAFPRISTNGKLEKQRFMEWYKAYDMPAAEE